MPAAIQHKYAEGSSGTAAVTLDSAATVGNDVLLCIKAAFDGIGTPTFGAANMTLDYTARNDIVFYRHRVAASGQTAFSSTLGSSTDWQCAAIEVPPLVASPVLYTTASFGTDGDGTVTDHSLEYADSVSPGFGFAFSALTGSPFTTSRTAANGSTVLPATGTNGGFHYKADLATGTGSIDYVGADAHPASYALIVYQMEAAAGDTNARLLGGDLLQSNLFGRLVA